jgi:hypothetical protein
MNNFFNIFNKIRFGNSSEKKAKEEEDVVGEFNLHFTIEQLPSNGVLDSIVKNHRINGNFVEKYGCLNTSYNDYNKALQKLIDQYKADTDELEYRYGKLDQNGKSKLLLII